MTATTSVRTEQQVAAQPAPSRRRRPGGAGLRGLLVLAVVAVTVASAFAGMLGRDRSMTHSDALLAPDVQGTHRFAEGEHLTLWGTEDAPSVELADRVIRLEANGTDRYASADGAVSLSVRRDDSGTVKGVSVAGEARPSGFAAHDPLHREEDLEYRGGGGTLGGTVLLPPGPGPHPAVVLVHGAAPTRRDATYLAASHLARRGVAALIYDKRGVGESTGSVTEASFDDLTEDALAGVSLLRRHPSVDPTRVGALGFSQGGWVVAQAARRSDDVSFVAAFSPSGFSPADQQAWLHGSMLAARGFDGSVMGVADRVDRMLYSSLDLVEAGMMPALPHVPGFWFHALDPHLDTAALWAGVRQPVLAAWGALDCQVPAHDSRDVLGRALHAAGNTDVTLTVLPGADHGFSLVEPCSHETGLADHTGYRHADGYLALAADWINGQPDASPVAESPTRSSVAEDDAVLGWHLPPPAPAPWYGTFAAQLAGLVTLLVAFGWIAGGWIVGIVRRRGPGDAAGHIVGAAALAGFVATITGFAAIAEIAMLGATHAAFLVGGPTVSGTSVLLAAARLLVPLAIALGAMAVVVVARRRRSEPRVRPVAASWVLGGAAAGLLVWGSYWTLLPLV